MVVLFLEDLINFFNVGKSINAETLSETAELIVEQYWNYRPEHFKLCFKWAKMGRLGNGQVYDRVDGAVILKWISDFDLLLTQNIESENKSISEKIDSEKKIDYKKIIEENLQRIQEEKNKQKKYSSQNEHVEILNRLQHLWINQFERRFDKSEKITCGGIKSLRFHEHYCDLHAWLNYKTEKIIHNLICK